MSLQDEHLKQALQSAPDRDLAPSDAVRQKVLDYAQNAATKQGGWFTRCSHRFNAWQIKSWQLVGMSTIASVFLVTIMVLPQPPDDAVWMGASEQEIAQVEEVKRTTANSAPEIALVLPNNDELFSPTVDDGLESSLGNSTASEPAASMSKKAKKERPVKRKAIRAPVEKAEESASTVSDTKLAPAPAPSRPVATVEAEADMEEKTVVADKEVSSATSRMESRQAAAKPSPSARKNVSPLNNKTKGVSLAKKDIQAGNLRLLFVGGTWPEGKPLVDVETGFPAEAINNAAAELTQAEMEAYNQIMRDWYRANHELTD